MRKGIASVAIIILIGVFVGYVAVHADVSARAAGCANASAAPALCQDLGQSVIAWQHALATSIPQMLLLFSFALICALLFVVIAYSARYYYSFIRERSLLPRSPLQLLFANGILHPKRF